jgi:hypothetical protein
MSKQERARSLNFKAQMQSISSWVNLRLLPLSSLRSSMDCDPSGDMSLKSTFFAGLNFSLLSLARAMITLVLSSQFLSLYMGLQLRKSRWQPRLAAM